MSWIGITKGETDWMRLDPLKKDKPLLPDQLNSGLTSSSVIPPGRGMNREHSSRGYKVVTGMSEVEACLHTQKSASR